MDGKMVTKTIKTNGWSCHNFVMLMYCAGPGEKMTNVIENA